MATASKRHKPPSACERAARRVGAKPDTVRRAVVGFLVEVGIVVPRAARKGGA